MEKKFSLKDALFNEETVMYLAELFKQADDTFEADMFTKEVMERLLELELKQRIVWIAEVLERHLPNDFKKACKLILKTLPPPLDPTKTDDDFGSFIFAPLGEYVARNGATKENLETSFSILYALTRRFSMEDVMRTFLQAYPKETLIIYKNWVKDKNYHVRRLVSESTRPFLPWSKRIDIDIEIPVLFLQSLHADKTRYVTRSVANHLNDISKVAPLLVVETLARWKKERKQDDRELEWMTKHALRTLVKKGNKEALELLGYKSDTEVIVERFSLVPQDVAPGQILTFSFDIKAQRDSLVLIDYAIDFVKANGATKPKVFKIKKVHLKKGVCVSIRKNHRLVADATTFTLYKGVHTLTLLINGKRYNATEFIIH
jgi:3-methyladenine DNA glycosylase AlkC